MTRAHRHGAVHDCTCPDPAADEPSWARDVPHEPIQMPIAGPGVIRGRPGDHWSSVIAATLAAFALVAIILVISAMVTAHATRKVANVAAEQILTVNDKRIQVLESALVEAHASASTEYAARQCMVTVARGDYDDFLRQLGWSKVTAVRAGTGLTGNGSLAGSLTVDAHGRMVERLPMLTPIGDIVSPYRWIETHPGGRP